MNESPNHMHIKFIHNDEGQTVSVKLDYIDFMLIVHEGCKYNPQFFKNMLESIKEMEEQYEEND